MESPNTSGIRQLFVTLLLFVVISMGFQALSLHFGYKRHLFSAELLASFVLISVGMKRLGAAVLVVAVILEIMLGMASIFILFEAVQVVDMAGFLFQARAEYLWGFFLALTLALVFTWMAARICTEKPSKKIYLLQLLVVVGLFQYQWVLSAEHNTFFSPTFAERKNLIFGSAMHFTREAMHVNKGVVIGNGAEDAEYVPIKNASAARTIWKDVPTSSRILFIIAESWGFPRDQAVLESQIQSLRMSPRVNNLEVGGIHAIGATVAGELREICGLIPTRLNFRKLTSEAVGECLPMLMAKKGYRTVGVHGANGVMYHRLQWWPEVGFSELIFREALPLAVSDCHSFPGYCDRDLVEVVAQKLQNDKAFVYWLTLNSHVPYDRRDIAMYREELCHGVFKEVYEEQLCNYQNLHVQFFEGLSRLIDSENLKGLEVVVVGDHSPVFSNESSRAKFERTKVPMIHFYVN
ncbi:MAG: hypothetical protein CVU36_11055 [Betaproteobacteria bacterium HGW-Betaproteobacteria-9]|nr:MAG: hypothetical protein CVU36_11055 [Betaproteobacteria bacterium HGW-Betaproteobacteria-9]